MSDLYLEPMAGGRWAISRRIGGKRIDLVERTRMDCMEDIRRIFEHFEIPYTKENSERYFPSRGKEGLCPTLELLELFSTIDRKGRSAMERTSV